jgi:hypothetical protein
MKSDRDQSIERLLRTLPRHDGGTLPDRCPDAEALAALADDTLARAMRRQIEAHVADCDRCQMLTAALVRSEGLSGIPAQDPVSSWKRRAVNWLVPAAAAATAVTLWMIVPGQRTSLPGETASELEIALMPPSMPNAPTAATLEGEIDALRDQSAAASADARGDRAIPSEVVPPSTSDLSRRQIVGQPGLKTEEPRSAEAVAGGLQASGASGQSARNDAGGREAAFQERVAVAAPDGSVASAPASPAALQARVAGLEVVSPNPQVRWRVGPGAVVQRSADRGMTWTAQQTGGTTALTAGSSPSADVCWLVGRGGLVLRTIDGGRQWQRVPFPETVDIIAVTASDAANASISSVDGRQFQTSDGGRTWIPGP